MAAEVEGERPTWVGTVRNGNDVRLFFFFSYPYLFYFRVFGGTLFSFGVLCTTRVCVWILTI